MTSQRDRFNRKPLRARGYDYADAGLSFVTICIRHMEARFGTVELTGVVLNHRTESLWAGIPERYPGVGLDAYVMMPNHLHGIVVLGTDPDITRLSLSVIIGQFKSLSTGVYSRGVRANAYPPFDRSLWQRGYHDHIIRNERSLEELRRYIDGNPARWLERGSRQ